MIRELLGELHNAYGTFLGEGSIAVLFAAAVLVIIRGIRKERKDILPLMLSVIGACGCVAARFIEKVRKTGDLRPAVRYAATVFAAVLCILCIVTSGRNVFSADRCEPAENDMHVPQDIVDAMSLILKDSDSPTVLTMPGWGPYFEGYSAKFTLAYDDPAAGDVSKMDEDSREMYLQLSIASPDMRKVTSVARRRGCSYAVISNEIWPDVPIDKCGYELMAQCGDCSVYREVSAP